MRTTTPSSLSRPWRLGAAVLVTVSLSMAAALALSAPASAHVTVAADDASRKADDAILTFRVPNEEDSATTTKVQIRFPTKNPIASVMPGQVPGWKVATTPTTFNPPIKTDDGDITSGVSAVIYTAAPGTKGIPVGGFQAFPILVGPLPDTETLAFPTIQTYSDGKTVSWIEPVTDQANMPENPTPLLTLSAAESEEGATAAPASNAGQTQVAAAASSSAELASKSSVNSARTLGILGLVAGLAGLALGGVAFLRSRSSHRSHGMT